MMILTVLVEGHVKDLERRVEPGRTAAIAAGPEGEMNPPVRIL